MEKTKITINAVHERDAKTFWKKLELKEKENCLICNGEVTANSFGALGNYNGKIVVCCDKGICFYEFHLKVRFGR